MVNLIIASSQKDKVRPWVDTLEPLYPLVFLDNIEQFLCENEHNEKILLILDALLITDSDQLSLICQSFYKVLVLNENRSSNQKIQYIYDGAWGYSDYSINKQLIMRTVESIIKNEVWLERHLIPQLLQGVIAKNSLLKSDEEFNTETLKTLSILTPREIEVTRLVYRGDDIDFISHSLNISSRTVKAHLGAVYRKLNVPDRFRLIVLLKNIDVGHLSNVEGFFEANETG